KSWDERKGEGQDVQSIIAQLIEKTKAIQEARVIFSTPSPIQGFGNSQGFEFQLQNRTGADITTFSKVGTDFISALSERPEIQSATTSFDPNFPQYEIEVNVEKTKEAGFTVNDILGTMQGYYDGSYDSNINIFIIQYHHI